jgi:TRAP-type C4-dicarboxylate transport system permease small subunit
MFQRVVHVLRRIREVVVMVLMAVLVVVVVASVIFRYVLLAPLSWSEEVGRYLMIWVGFLAASIAIQQGMHVGIDFIVNWVRPEVAAWLRRVARGLTGVFLLIVTAYGFVLVINLWEQWSPVLQFRMTWPYLAIPVGCLLMLLELVVPSAREADIVRTY